MILRYHIRQKTLTVSMIVLSLVISGEFARGQSVGDLTIRVHDALRITNPSYEHDGKFRFSNGKLVRADFRNCRLSNISTLGNHRSLEDLNLARTTVSDINALRGMRLVKLDIGFTSVRSLESLHGMPLRELSLKGCPVSDLTPLTGMSLERLDIYDTEVTNVKVLEAMPLKWISVSLTNVKGGPESLKKLSTLKTINNKPSVEFWQQLEGIHWLYVDESRSWATNGTIWRVLKQEEGFARTIVRAPVQWDLLQNYDVMIIRDIPELLSYGQEELATIRRFVAEGGGLLVVGDVTPNYVPTLIRELSTFFVLQSGRRSVAEPGGLQLNLIGQELRARNLPYDAPSALAFADAFEGIRAVYSIVRILRNILTTEEDYPAYRDLLGLLSGVGKKTAQEIGDECINHNQNFRALFHGNAPPAWLSCRATSAVQRVISVVQILNGWTMADTLSIRVTDLITLLSTYVFTTGTKAAARIQAWTALSGALPPQMTLEELLLFLGANTEAEQESILDTVEARISQGQSQQQSVAQKKIRILTMHGSKGLTASVVFIPSVEQGIMPNRRALQATGLLIEQRRLFYVALTRARACCIITHAARRTGFQAQAVAGASSVSLPRSQFLNEMRIPTVQRNGGLSGVEAQLIVSEINNL